MLLRHNITGSNNVNEDKLMGIELICSVNDQTFRHTSHFEYGLLMAKKYHVNLVGFFRCVIHNIFLVLQINDVIERFLAVLGLEQIILTVLEILVVL